MLAAHTANGFADSLVLLAHADRKADRLMIGVVGRTRPYGAPFTSVEVPVFRRLVRPCLLDREHLVV